MRRALFIFLLFFIILAINLPSFAQEKQPEKFTPGSVTAIEVRGNRTISSNTIISKLKTQLGAPYQENVVSDDLKRLYLLGFFSDIKIDTEDHKGGVKIIVTVTERPTIKEITFSGMQRISIKDEKLKDLLKSKETQYLDYPSLAEDVRTLKKLYEKKGYIKVQIDYQVDIDEEYNRAKVEFNIEEGTRLRIKDIFVKGNKTFSRGRILKLMKTKRAWFFNAGVLKDDVLKEDIKRIKSFYQKEGFTDVEVDHEVSSHPKRSTLLFITIKIEEGHRYLVGNITVQGNNDIAKKDILAALEECTTGKVFSQEALEKDVLSIHGFYFDQGYISARVQEATSLNPYTRRIDIVYNIAENDVHYVDRIRIRGNVKTKDVVIRRELRIYPGDKFDGEKLRRSRERIRNLGFFDETYGIHFLPEPASSGEAIKKDLVVDLKESKTGTFSFGGGYSTVEEFVGFVEIEQKNFDWKNWPYFTGAGQDLRLRASFGSYSNSFDLSFTEPWVFDYPVSFGFDVYKRTHERESDIGYGYDEDILGGDLRLGKELTEHVRANLKYRYDQIEITNITDNATDDLKKEYGKNSISSITPSLSFDSRDNVFNPRRGNLLSASMELAGGPLAGDKDFWKIYGRASHYFPLPRNSVIEAKVRVGATDSYDDSDSVPIYERFFAGGAYTVRGYEERSIGPIDSASEDPLGGEAMVVGNLEYVYPLFDFLKVAVFYDAGNVWSQVSDIGSGGFKSGVGLGVRINTPIGPIKLDYGVPLNKAAGEDEKKSGRFHFSASHGF